MGFGGLIEEFTSICGNFLVRLTAGVAEVGGLGRDRLRPIGMGTAFVLEAMERPLFTVDDTASVYFGVEILYAACMAILGSRDEVLLFVCASGPKVVYGAATLLAGVEIRLTMVQPFAIFDVTFLGEGNETTSGRVHAEVVGLVVCILAALSAGVLREDQKLIIAAGRTRFTL